MAGDTVLITGANGLLGRGLAERLARAGRPLVGMDATAPPAGGVPWPFVQADINDAHRLYATLARHRVGRIVHCGGISGYMVARDDPFRILETNIRGTMNVFEAARAADVTRVVFPSSSATYGAGAPSPLSEDVALRPTSVYGATKVAGEAILNAYAAERGVDGVALRIFHVFGPRRATECFIRMMIEGALAGRPTRIPHGPRSRRQYLYVEDALDALHAALDAPPLKRRVYNITGGTSLSLAEVAERVARIVPGVEVSFGDDPHGEQYTLGEVDISAARGDLGYVPRFGLDKGIAAYAEWLRAGRG
ncbi:MAG: NAD(P)-dependent oxidoreductase [Proteobacteria bacterium]|nr:NAD(P)-dependent oxidoreductase [Pseudomonadota bacterium]